MKQGPSNNLLRLARSIFDNETQREEFVNNIQNGNSAKPAIIWTKERPTLLDFEVEEIANIPYANLVDENAKLGSHVLHQEGLYYCLDLSSVLCASVVLGVKFEEPPRVLDMCASPGGKSIFTSIALNPYQLVCNEVIKKRTKQLASNLTRCGIKNAIIQSSDPSYFANLDDKFDLTIVDAPCSGQSLIARGEESQGCFHPATINMNSNRQKRIIANSAQSVKTGGYLAYITCTYSEGENEDVVSWLLKKFPKFKHVLVPHLSHLQSHLTDFPCYRIFPGRNNGAGGFAALLQST